MGDARRLPETSARRGIGWIVAGSLAIGLVTALVLVAAPFIEARRMSSPAWSCWHLLRRNRCRSS
jgi:hypothetical protein